MQWWAWLLIGLAQTAVMAVAVAICCACDRHDLAKLRTIHAAARGQPHNAALLASARRGRYDADQVAAYSYEYTGLAEMFVPDPWNSHYVVLRRDLAFPNAV